jgi:hypothetical protein
MTSDFHSAQKMIQDLITTIMWKYEESLLERAYTTRLLNMCKKNLFLQKYALVFSE